MRTEEAQARFSELIDQLARVEETARQLQGEITAAFARVAKGKGVNPPLAVLEISDSLERMRAGIQREINSIIDALDAEGRR